MSTFPPATTGTLTQTTPSYLYVQYNDDSNLQAFVASFNAMAQGYVTALANLNLPVYTTCFGGTLDWVGTYLYGIPRPSLPSTGTPEVGALATAPLALLYLTEQIPPVNPAYYATSDDVYQRVLTWALFKGDGKICTFAWLKRRIVRFLTGINGTAPPIDFTNQVSIVPTGDYAATIAIPNDAIGVIFKSAVEAGVLELPFQWTWTVVFEALTSPLLDSSGGTLLDSTGATIYG